MRMLNKTLLKAACNDHTPNPVGLMYLVRRVVVGFMLTSGSGDYRPEQSVETQYFLVGVIPLVKCV